MATIYIDGKPYEAEANENLLKACNALGMDIPYFCYHPALGSVGSCRLCAVKRFKDASDTRGRIVMSCMEPVTEGMYISADDAEIKEFRASIIESLMTNHPHDCPVCDEGGECHLQDMVVMTGHNQRRYEFKKRTYNNQNLGPHIHHEMNRCIQCYRCVRYYNDYAGGTDFGVFGAHNHLYFGRFEEGALESEFSGNLVEVCPTGVFTDKTLKKHYTRKWDLTNTPSVCNGCSVGCNTIIGERYGEVRRTLNRYNEEVNGYFLCDRGRFGYEFINDKKLRLSKSLAKTEGLLMPVEKENALQIAVNSISTGKTIGIGSPTASLESNYALLKLVGANNFYAGIATKEFEVIKTIVQVYNSGSVKVNSLNDIEHSEAVIVLGEDILKTAPRLALTVRQSTRNKPLEKAAKLNVQPWLSAAVKNIVGKAKGPLLMATPNETNTDNIASCLYRGNCDAIINFAQLLSALIAGNSIPDGTSEQDKQMAETFVATLKTCKSVAVISGTQAGSSKLIEISASLTEVLSKAGLASGLYCVVPEANSLGLAILSEQSLDAAYAAEAANVVILENNLFERPESAKTEAFINHSKHVIVLDHSQNEMVSKANLVLASGTFAESEGTLVNAEGRIQRYYSVLPPNDNISQSWKWLSEITAKKAVTEPDTFDAIVTAIGAKYPLLKHISQVSPDAAYRQGGMRIPRQTPRFSGRGAIVANSTVHEPKPVQDDNSALAYSMEGSNTVVPESLKPYYWSPGWNSVQASVKYLRDLNNVMKAKNPGVKIFSK